MTRIRQVCGMSTRQSLNRPRMGITRQFQNMELSELRLNKAQTSGFMGPATTITNHRAITGHKETRYGTEKIFNSDISAKALVAWCAKVEPGWRPSKWARKEWREAGQTSKVTAKGLLG